MRLLGISTREKKRFGARKGAKGMQKEKEERERKKKELLFQR